MREEPLQKVVKKIIGRLKVLFCVRTDTELAKELGVHQSTISAWKTRGTLDFALLITKCNGIDWNWLLDSPNHSSEEEPDHTILYERDPRDIELLAAKDKTIATQEQLITALQHQIREGSGSMDLGSARFAEHSSLTGKTTPS